VPIISHGHGGATAPCAARPWLSAPTRVRDGCSSVELLDLLDGAPGGSEGGGESDGAEPPASLRSVLLREHKNACERSLGIIAKRESTALQVSAVADYSLPAGRHSNETTHEVKKDRSFYRRQRVTQKLNALTHARLGWTRRGEVSVFLLVINT
jgi:hypothetical protein